MRPVLVLPTYNERGNIERMLAAVLATTPDLRVLVVDDASPDGTGDLVARAAARTDRVRLLRRPGKNGLGSAYREGFAHAMTRMAADVVLQMDADFSHDPGDLPRLLKGIESADVVIGSRYVEGGCAEGWPWPRRLISRSVNMASGLLTGFRVRDCSSGFRAYRAAAMDAAGLGRTRCNGFAFQIEMTLRVLAAGLRVREAPIVFRERRVGRSKMDLSIMNEALRLLTITAARKALGCAGGGVCGRRRRGALDSHRTLGVRRVAR